MPPTGSAHQALEHSIPKPILDDLGIGVGALMDLGAEGPTASRCLSLAGTADPDAGISAQVESSLGATDAFLLRLGGHPSDVQLAAWRNALWPLLHTVAIYTANAGKLKRRVQNGKSDLGETSSEDCTILACRRRLHVMSPAATVEKFDMNAAGWNGEPGGPGYPHFRWMRKYVGHFVPAREGMRILDFGCGAGWVGIEAARGLRAAELCSFDPSPEMVRFTQENAEACGITSFTGRTGFGEDSPFPGQGEEPFDLVISSGVVSFSPDFESWYAGLTRSVRPGGTLVIGDIHRQSHGFKMRRRTRPLLPVRELNALTREEVRAELEKRGFVHQRSAGYQLSWPLPQAMHFNETRLGGLFSHPFVWLNAAAAGFDRMLGSPFQDRFDSWVMHFERPA